MSKIITYEYIKEKIEKESHILLSKEYISAHEKLKIKCDKNHEYEVTWNNFNNGRRCKKCAIIKRSEKKRFNINVVMKYVESFNYKFISTLYINSRTKYLFECPNGHIFTMSYNNFKNGRRCKKCFYENNSKNKHWNLKGGVEKKNIPLYDTYAHQIDYCEEVRRNPEDENVLQVKCTYCGKWYIPKRKDIQHRINSLNGNQMGESRLYCSNECKKECPIFWKRNYSAEENNTKQLSREVQPELRQMVFERDGYQCKKCGNTKSLHCHHVEGIRWDPLESADIDKCITVCKKCHKKIHKKEGCGYQDMKCKKGD